MQLRSATLFVAIALAGCSRGATSDSNDTDPVTPDRFNEVEGRKPPPEPSLSGLVLGPQGGCVQVNRKQVWCWGTELLDSPADRSPDEPALIGDLEFDLARNERCKVAEGKITCNTDRPDSIRDVVDVESSTRRSCAVGRNGEVRCWERDDGVQGVIQGAIDVEVHVEGVCVRTEAGRVACPGGQLLGGTGSLELVADIDEITELEFGSYHGCMLDRAGRVRCFGWNGWGQLGVGDSQPHEGLVEVTLPGPATELAAAGNRTCAIAGDALLCWGVHETMGNRSHFGRFEFPFEAVALHAQAHLSCATKADGSLWCWGTPEHQRVYLDGSNGGAVRAATPHAVLSPWPVTEFHTEGIRSGNDFILTRSHWPLELHEDDQRLRIRGVAGFATDGVRRICVFGGATGLRCVEDEDELTTATWVPKLRDVSNMSVRVNSMCAVHGGRVSCLSRQKPDWVQIPGLGSIRSVVDDGIDQRCALADDGRITCWQGSADADGRYEVYEGPYVLDERDVVEIAWGWGLLARTKSGALRSGPALEAHEPFETLIDAGVLEVAGAPGSGVLGHACARVDGDGDGQSELIVCIGDDRAGQLGRLGEHVSLQPRTIAGN